MRIDVVNGYDNDGKICKEIRIPEYHGIFQRNGKLMCEWMNPIEMANVDKNRNLLLFLKRRNFEVEGDFEVDYDKSTGEVIVRQRI